MTKHETVKRDVLRVLKRRKHGASSAELRKATGHEKMPVYRALCALRGAGKAAMQGTSRCAVWRAA